MKCFFFRKCVFVYPFIYQSIINKIDVIVSASALHDLGKIAIPDSILMKPGRFTPEEFNCMKAHTVRGCEIVSNIRGVWDEEYAKTGYEICRYHHERFDGKGYPDGLKGDEIPVSAQIVSIADVYDALVNERVSSYSPLLFLRVPRFPHSYTLLRYREYQ